MRGLISRACASVRGTVGAMPTLLLCDFPAKTELPRWSSFSPFVLQTDRPLALAKPRLERYLDRVDAATLPG